jgi:hypothetical protein
VDTSDLVVTEDVVLALALESLHTDEVQVPLVRIAHQSTDFLASVGLPAVGVTGSLPVSAGAAHTRGGDELTVLTLVKGLVDLLNLRLDLGDLDDVAVSVVVGAMLRRDGNLEEREEREQHGHHVLGLAEVGHGGESRMFLVCNDWKSTSPEKTTRVLELRIKNGCAKERNDLGGSKGLKRERSLNKKPRRQRLRRIKDLAWQAGAGCRRGHISRQTAAGTLH